MDEIFKNKQIKPNVNRFLGNTFIKLATHCAPEYSSEQLKLGKQV
jgi:hypothetical protein